MAYEGGPANEIVRVEERDRGLSPVRHAAVGAGQAALEQECGRRRLRVESNAACGKDGFGRTLKQTAAIGFAQER
jgi:hypothetical protein